MIVLLDNGHGINTTGKCSPDKRLREYAYTREIAKRLKAELDQYEDIDCRIMVPEDYDVTLEERCKRVNEVCKQHLGECIFISIHNNAAGSGAWMSARGWQVHVARSGSENSRTLAKCLYDVCTSLGLTARKPKPMQKWWDNDFYILKHTVCPAVLTENFFQDNKQDVEWLLSDKGKEGVTSIHVGGVLAYYAQKYGKAAKKKGTLPMTGCNMK